MLSRPAVCPALPMSPIISFFPLFLVLSTRLEVNTRGLFFDAIQFCDRVSSKTSETTILNQELNFGGVRRLVGGTNHPNASTTAQRGKREQQTRILSNIRYAVFLSSYCSDCWEFEVNGSAEVQMQAEVSFFFLPHFPFDNIHSLTPRSPSQATYLHFSLTCTFIKIEVFSGNTTLDYCFRRGDAP
jgi:hypothetical protein